MTKLLRDSRWLGLAAAVLILSAGIAVALRREGREPAPVTRADACESGPPAATFGKTSGVWRKVQLPPTSGCFDLVASKRDTSGVAADSEFLLESKSLLTATDVRQRLRADPPTSFSVSPQSGRRFTIRPSRPLREDTLYRFTMLDRNGATLRSWAMQSQAPLRVVQTLPADQSSNVPLDVGIELTFSHGGVSGARERFSITPAVKGRFETHKRTVVFVPSRLSPRTLYTVALRAGSRVPGSDLRIRTSKIFRFETGMQRRGERVNEGRLAFSRTIWESPTRTPPALGLYRVRAVAPGTKLPLTVYRYADAQAFIASLGALTSIPQWAYLTRTRFVARTEGLQRAVSFDAELRRGSPGSDLYIVFPEALPAGYYLVASSFAGARLQTWLQVTDLATYVAISAKRTLVWVNDLQSGRAAPGAVLRAAHSSFRARTGADGVALFDTPSQLLRVRPDPLGQATDRVDDLIVRSGTDEAVVALSDFAGSVTSYAFRQEPFSGDPSIYWRFLYTDRHLYRPADRVHFWGLMRLREAPLRGRPLTVKISGGDQFGRPTLVSQTDIRTSQAGTFIGSLPLKGASPGYYALEVLDGKQTVASTYVEVRDFATPAYKLDVETSRRAVFAGDRLDFEILARFFEGTPVPGLRVRAHMPGDTRDLVTDDSGRTVYRMRAGFAGLGAFNWVALNARPALAEEGEITGGAQAQVFAAAIALESSARRTRDRVTVRGTAFRVDLSRLNAGTEEDLADYKGPVAAGRVVTATVTETFYRKVKEGEDYDYVNKVVRPRYRFVPVRRPHGTFSATTDRAGRFSISFAATRDRSYEIKLAVKDDEGRTFRDQAYLYSSFDFGDVPNLIPTDPGPYDIGERVELSMRRGSEEMPAGGRNRYLFYDAQNGIRSYAMRNQPRHSFRFTAAHIPNVEAFAVRFTGTGYEQTYSQTLRFDPAGRKLKVSVTPDKKRYRPGERARLNVFVTDVTGRPVKAEVVLAAVDEAVFRLQGQSFFGDLSILDTLYTPVGSGVLTSHVSHAQPTASPQASAGGETGGEGGARENFRDVALFDRVTTGTDGRASTTFALPDNLTSWRITALAVTRELGAGSGIAMVPVGLPVFADVALNTTYLISDRPVLRVRAFGSDLRAGDEVAFSVKAPTLFSGERSARGRAFTPVEVALAQLQAGRHRVSVSVRGRGRADTLVRTIAVVPSRLVRAEARFEELQAGKVWRPRGGSDGAMQLALVDHNRGRYYAALSSLAYIGGDRVDQMLARDLAQKLLVRYFREPAALPAVFRPDAYQRSDGGIGILPFADSDLVVSARIADVAPELFGRQSLARYFRKIAGDAKETRERGLIALYGRAALGENVLVDLRQASRGDLAPRERIYAALAYAAVGDHEEAERRERMLLRDFGQARGDAVRLNVGRDQDDVLEATALTAMLAAALGDPLAPGLHQYVQDNAARDLLLALDQIAFLQRALPRLSGAPVSFSFVFDGKRETRRLERGDSISLLLTPADLSRLNLRANRGTLGIATTILAALDPKSVPTDADVRITRRYESGLDIGQDELVRIVLDYRLGPKAVDGCYRVTDFLPSGLKPVTRLYEFGVSSSVSFPWSIEGQRVSFCAFRQSREHRIVYYARVIGPGSYVAERALIQAERGGESYAFSGSQRVRIR
jgi:alpha-2-macroglobulin